MAAQKPAPAPRQALGGARLTASLLSGLALVGCALIGSAISRGMPEPQVAACYIPITVLFSAAFALFADPAGQSRTGRRLIALGCVCVVAWLAMRAAS